MSPIGRVFIVLNLLLAGGFLAVSGTHLQKQHNYKAKLEQAEKDHKAKVEALDAQIATLDSERGKFENAKTANETEKNRLAVQIAQLEDEKKQLMQRLSSLEGDVKQLVATAQSGNAEAKAAHERAEAAYKKAIADEATRDEAVRAKDAAVAENRDLKTKITGLEEAIVGKDKNIATLESDKAQLGLLVKVAESYGFIRAMAAPNLAGLVTTSNDRLCTIQITDNPGKINIKEAIEQGKFSFAIYDASGYKGEAVAERYEESANAVLCKVVPVKGAIKEGDKAATKTP